MRKQIAGNESGCQPIPCLGQLKKLSMTITDSFPSKNIDVYF
ncbi:MAG: hypothetical protein WBP41_15335 [Saprospiraceae bacterium]